jgi:hypothetical protein
MRLHHALLIYVALAGSVAHAAPDRSTEADAPTTKKRPRYVGSIGYNAAMRKESIDAKRTRRADDEDDARSTTRSRRTRSDADDADAPRPTKRSKRADDDAEDAAIDARLTKTKRSKRARTERARATIDDDDDDEVIVKDVVDGVEVPVRKPRTRRR